MSMDSFVPDWLQEESPTIEGCGHNGEGQCKACKEAIHDNEYSRQQVQDTYDDSAFDDLTKEPPQEGAYNQAYLGLIGASRSTQGDNPEDKLWVLAMVVIPVVILIVGAVLLISR